MVTKYEFDPSLLNEKVQLFPDEIENDPWVVYHGTSNIFEPNIDEYGFQWESSMATKEEVSNVVDIFTEMNWGGNDRGALAVLKPFSLEHDFALGNSKPIYFAESSYRAMLYATHDFAGGETARALRKCIYELETYLHDQNIRDADMEYKMMEYNQLLSLNAKAGMRPAEIDLKWLESKVEKLSELKNRCANVHLQSEYGVVYAVKFTQKDIDEKSNFDYHASMGLKVFSRIPREKIVGKIYIPHSFERLLCNDKRRLGAIHDIGIIGQLSKY